MTLSVVSSCGENRNSDPHSPQYNNFLDVKGSDHLVVNLVETEVRRPANKRSRHRRLHPKWHNSNVSPIRSNPEDGEGRVDLVRGCKNGSLRSKREGKGEVGDAVEIKPCESNGISDGSTLGWKRVTLLTLLVRRWNRRGCCSGG